MDGAINKRKVANDASSQTRRLTLKMVYMLRYRSLVDPTKRSEDAKVLGNLVNDLTMPESNVNSSKFETLITYLM